MNRPKAERSHPGVCPSRGPASVRPLRKERTASVFAVGAGPRPARQDFKYALVKRRGDPCGRPCRMQNQASIPFVGAAHRAARERPDEDIGPYEKNAALPVFAVSLSRT